jgi:hypothetical protein
VGVIVRRDDERGTMVKKSDGGWSSDDVVIWLGRRQNKDMIK